MQSSLRQECSPALSPGGQAVLSLVSHVSQVAAPTGQGKVPLATCAAEDACLHPPKHGDAGIARSTSIRRGQTPRLPTSQDRAYALVFPLPPCPGEGCF